MTTLSVVVPCFNEQEGLSQLLAALADVRRMLGDGYGWEVVFVDDGSTDGTAASLNDVCRQHVDVRVIHHPTNRGLGAALRTGFAAATGDLVATMDSDCTYDPREVIVMLPWLERGADLVVASPYHPRGRTTQVPAGRLFLSRNLSRLYSWVTGARLWTYTSLFRLYRAEVLRAVPFRADGFVAPAEILVEALRRGYRAVEYPACLTGRRYGASKAELFRLIGGHLQLLWRLAQTRIDAPATGR